MNILDYFIENIDRYISLKQSDVNYILIKEFCDIFVGLDLFKHKDFIKYQQDLKTCNFDIHMFGINKVKSKLYYYDNDNVLQHLLIPKEAQEFIVLRFS